MDADERYHKYLNEDLDLVIMKIWEGSIKSGKYSGRIKIDKKFKIGKELFGNGNQSESGK